MFHKVHLAVTAYRNCCCLRDAGKQNGVDYQFIIRVLTFGIFIALGIVYVFLSAWQKSHLVCDQADSF